jgi:uncharacterized protein YpmB
VKKSTIDKFIIIVIFILIAIGGIIFLFRISEKPKVTTKKEYEKTVKTITKTYESVDIYAETLGSSYQKLIYEVIYTIERYINKEEKNVKYNVIFIEKNKKVFPSSERRIFILPVNDPEFITPIEDILKDKNDKKVFLYSFMITSPDGRCTQPNEYYLKYLFSSEFVNPLPDYDECVKGYFGTITPDKVYVMDPYSKKFEELNIKPTLRMEFVKPSDYKYVLAYVVYKGEKYPLLIKKENSMLVTYKLGNNPVLDEKIMSYVINFLFS